MYIIWEGIEWGVEEVLSEPFEERRNAACEDHEQGDNTTE